MIDGVVELIGVDPVKDAGAIQIADAAVRGDKQHTVLQIFHVLDVFEFPADDLALFFKDAAADIICIDMIRRRPRQERSVRIKRTGFKLLISLNQLRRAQNLSAVQQEKPAVIGHRRHISALIRADADGVIHLRQRIHLFKAAVQRQDLHAAGGADVIISLRIPDNRLDGIGGQTFPVIDHVDNAFINGDGKTIVIRSDPQPPFLIHIQAVDIPDRVVAGNPPEFVSVIPVQARIRSYPENAVMGFRDIVCLTARQPVAAAENRLNIIIVIHKLRLSRPGHRTAAQHEAHHQQTGQCRSRGRFRLFRRICRLIFCLSRLPDPDDFHYQVQKDQGNGLI